MTDKTGGPAFPTSDWDENDKAYKMHGMTLRDYFAAKAMQAIRISKSNTDYDKVAEHAYFMANEMLKAREK
jgi:hypothetical protein